MINEVYGAAAGAQLGDVSSLLLPWAQDPWGALRPPLSVEALRLSCELASSVYGMDVEPWLRAGWRDVTLQVDNELLTDFMPAEKAGAVARFTAGWRLRRARSRLRPHSSIGQVAGALRQWKESDTGKAMVMIHPAGPSHYVVAVGFMGTGARLYDWISNFRMNAEEGVHKGFLQLTRQFERNEERIQFPETARELGIEKLTLSHILEEAARPDSRFTLWCCGHSQGGALMQVWALHKIRDGLLPRNLLGYGFASPTAVDRSAVANPAAFPLYHLLNSEDLVPRVGAELHLGVGLVYPTDEALRLACYDWPTDTESVRRRAAIAPFVARMTDTPSAILTTVAYLQALMAQSPGDMLAAFSTLGMTHPPLNRIVTAADTRMDALLRFLCRHMGATYARLTGKPLDLRQVAQLRGEMLPLMQRMGVRAYASALSDLMACPHGISPRKGAFIGAYPYIVRHGIDRLMPFVWQNSQPPRRIYFDSPDSHARLLVRRRAPAPRQARGARRYSQLHPRRRVHDVPLISYGGMRPGETLIHMKE